MKNSLQSRILLRTRLIAQLWRDTDKKAIKRKIKRLNKYIKKRQK